MKSSALAWAATLAAAAGLAGQACAQPHARSSRPQSQCFDAHMIEGFTAPDQSTVYVRTGVNEVWRLKLFAPCPNVDWDQQIALQNHTGGPFICNPLEAEILAHAPGLGLQRCPVSQMRKLTPAELAALPKKDRP